MPKAIFERLASLVPGHIALSAFPELPTLWDVDARLRMMDEFPGMQQVLSLANPPIELLGPPDKTPELARIANDGLAELCRKHPEHFPTFIASMPMNNVGACVREADRAIGELGAKGIQIFTNVLGKPLSAVEFRPIFSRIYAELPALKIITHHMCGMVPFYAGKIDLGFYQIFHAKTAENPVA